MLELQAKRQVRAEDLAATFEVSKRTIYRDMLALTESGVPVVSIPGQGYSLVEGYFLPPLAFHIDEAMMLLLGVDFVAQHFDAQYRAAAHSANRKIKAVLPEQVRGEVEYLENSIRFFTFNKPAAPDILQQLRRAIIQHRTVRFRYHARYADNSSGEAHLREADPYALMHIGGTWMLTAYCHLRHDIRHFRLDRMEAVTVLNEVYTRPEDFTIELNDQPDRTVIVRALFDHQTARRVREAPSGYQVAQEDQANGLLVTFMVRQPTDLLNWLLSWGSHVQVLEPNSLREHMSLEGQGILENHRSGSLPS